MAKSNIRIKKICEWCAQEFVAKNNYEILLTQMREFGL